jgi:hypothetical protein
MNQEEYDRLKQFLAYFVDSGGFGLPENLTPDTHPAHVLSKMERLHPNRANEGLRLAINDCLAVISNWSSDDVRAFDSELRNRGIIGLFELQRGHSKKYKAILKRGAIKSVTEYYMLRGILDDTDLPGSDSERDAIETMLFGYESRVGPRSDLD